LVFVVLIVISKLEYFGHKMYRSESTTNDLMLGLTDGNAK
jgi:hypothetical protein